MNISINFNEMVKLSKSEKESILKIFFNRFDLKKMQTADTDKVFIMYPLRLKILDAERITPPVIYYTAKDFPEEIDGIRYIIVAEVIFDENNNKNTVDNKKNKITMEELLETTNEFITNSSDTEVMSLFGCPNIKRVLKNTEIDIFYKKIKKYMSEHNIKIGDIVTPREDINPGHPDERGCYDDRFATTDEEISIDDYGYRSADTQDEDDQPTIINGGCCHTGVYIHVSFASQYTMINYLNTSHIKPENIVYIGNQREKFCSLWHIIYFDENGECED